MKVNFFKGEYNPKIDYLICKNLLIKLPNNFCEFELRKAYLRNYKRYNKELKVLIKIKNYLLNHSIYKFSVKDFIKLIYIITGKRIEYSYRINFIDMKKEELYNYILYLRYISDKKISELMLKIMLIYVYSKNNQIIIPQRGYIKELLKDNTNIEEILSLLENKTSKLNMRHDSRINSLVRQIIRDKKEEFLYEFPLVKEYGVYGSFGVKKENEYSDIDILVICDNNNNELKEAIKEYWKRYISINIDIKIVNYFELDEELTMCQKNTLRMVM